MEGRRRSGWVGGGSSAVDRSGDGLGGNGGGLGLDDLLGRGGGLFCGVEGVETVADATCSQDEVERAGVLDGVRWRVLRRGNGGASFPLSLLEEDEEGGTPG
jgi:hypothetical protein